MFLKILCYFCSLHFSLNIPIASATVYNSAFSVDSNSSLNSRSNRTNCLLAISNLFILRAFSASHLQNQAHIFLSTLGTPLLFFYLGMTLLSTQLRKLDSWELFLTASLVSIFNQSPRLPIFLLIISPIDLFFFICIIIMLLQATVTSHLAYFNSFHTAPLTSALPFL